MNGDGGNQQESDDEWRNNHSFGGGRSFMKTKYKGADERSQTTISGLLICGRDLLAPQEIVFHLGKRGYAVLEQAGFVLQ